MSLDEHRTLTIGHRTLNYASILADLSIPHEVDVPLAPLTWYGIGGPAKVLARPSSTQQLSALAARCHENELPVYVLGRGANLLVKDQGVDGIVVKLDDTAFKQLKITGGTVVAGAGYDLMKLVQDTARSGLAGIEVLAGIPATIGGAVRMNAGGAFGDIGQSVRRVTLMDASGHVYQRDRDDLVFDYRSTNIVARYIIDAELDLVEDDPDELVKRVKEIYLFKKNTQPLAEYSAGCAFKNPITDPVNRYRESAGKLIDQAGLKGYRVGGAHVSTHHANFIAGDQGCTASDVLAVIEHIEETIQTRFGVTLEREVVVWP